MTKISHNRLNQAATIVAVIVAVILVLSKGFAWFTTKSLSIQASLIDSILDSGASLVNFFAVMHAARPADREHRFGHGKLEAVACVCQSMFIAGSALFLIIDCVQRLIHPEPTVYHQTSIIVMVVSVVLTLGLLAFQRFVYTRTGSLAIKADSLHYKGDILTSLAVLAALILSDYFRLSQIDSLLGGLIALYIAKTSWDLFKHALDELMDRELSHEIRDTIKEIVKAHTDVLGLHDLRTRSSGQKYFIQLHLELDPELSLINAHRISERVMASILEKFPDAEVLIHEDPKGHDTDHQHFPDNVYTERHNL